MLEELKEGSTFVKRNKVTMDPQELPLIFSYATAIESTSISHFPFSDPDSEPGC